MGSRIGGSEREPVNGNRFPYGGPRPRRIACLDDLDPAFPELCDAAVSQPRTRSPAGS